MSNLSEVSKERIRLMYQIKAVTQIIKKSVLCRGQVCLTTTVYLVRWVFLYMEAFKLASVGVICQ